MLKKIAVAAILISGSSVALANISGSPYIGAGLGLNQQIFENKYGATETNFGGTGGLVNIYGGYGARVNKNIYLGGEVLANTTTGVVDAAEASSASLKFRTKYSYGASLIPGLMLSDNTMLYARAGVVKTKFNVKAEVPGASSSDNNTVSGAQFGLGLQTKVTQKMDLRGEYVYTDYNTFHSLGNKIEATSGQANFGLVYNIS